MKNKGLKLLLYQNTKPSMIEWFIQNLEDQETCTCDKYPNIVFYGKDNETLFELCQDTKNNGKLYFQVHSKKIWKVFETNFSLNYNDTQMFIKFVVEDTLKLGSITPNSKMIRTSSEWMTPTKLLQ